MLKDLEELLRAREQTVDLGPHKLVVRECASAADLVGDATQFDKETVSWRLLIACTFEAKLAKEAEGDNPAVYEAGEPAFTADDIPALKASSKWKLGPLIAAVNKVNGFDVAAEAKNSVAAPA